MSMQVQEFRTAAALRANYKAVKALPWQKQVKSPIVRLARPGPILAAPEAIAPTPVADSPPAQRDWLLISSDMPQGKFMAADIRRAVLTVTGLKLEAFQARSRVRCLCRARQLFYWLARKYTNLSSGMIGKFAGIDDHSTVLHGINVVEANMAAARPSIEAVLSILEGRK